MSTQNNVDSQRTMENPGPSKESEKKFPPGATKEERQNADERLREADLEKEKQEKQPSPEKNETPRRYDESDPNWVEPDVQMGSKANQPLSDY